MAPEDEWYRVIVGCNVPLTVEGNRVVDTCSRSGSIFAIDANYGKIIAADVAGY